MDIMKEYNLQKVRLLSSPTGMSTMSNNNRSNFSFNNNDGNDPNEELIGTNELDISQFYTPDELKLDWSWLTPVNHPITLTNLVATNSITVSMANAQHTLRELYITGIRTDFGQNGLTSAPGFNGNVNNATSPNNAILVPLSNNITHPSNYLVQEAYGVTNLVDLTQELVKMQKGLFKHLFSF
jgi:hypothetical protein